ncbi:hypothetical protein [Roseibacillus persicicus]|uniref:hypothetical protein n=1 Tax=Roseibacillus persicicus TaxID=454148 RepID=UPI00280C5325|nr:hypothetical protein [Roseibacillus persicicus]MDQ8192695.1 hypothetical protein [Roseibacillus persicicus]
MRLLLSLFLCSTLSLFSQAFSLRLVVEKGTPGAIEMKWKTDEEEEAVYVSKEEIISDKHIEEAHPDLARRGAMYFRVNERGGVLLRQTIENADGEKTRVAAIINGHLDFVGKWGGQNDKQFLLTGLKTEMNSLMKLGRTLSAKGRPKPVEQGVAAEPDRAGG